MILRKVITNDGSPTLYSERYRQHYHNPAGALTESRHVFFDRTGLTGALKDHKNVTVFEIGFGTGLHLLLLEWLRRETGSTSKVQFYSVEKFPVESTLIQQLDHSGLFPGMDDFIEKANGFAEALYRASPGEMVSDEFNHSGAATDASSGAKTDASSDAKTGTSTGAKTDAANGAKTDTAAGTAAGAETGAAIGTGSGTGSNPVTLHVFRGDFSDLELSRVNRPVHFFLHDAFSPAANPELWTREVFEKLYRLAGERAVLGTYASATETRASMILAGWHVARCQGPPGKREMTLASPDESMLAGYKRVNELRLRERFGGTT